MKSKLNDSKIFVRRAEYLMKQEDRLNNLWATVEKIENLTRQLYEDSDEFPAINRNCKRILASAKMLKLNLEQGSGRCFEDRLIP
jgi:hypothetical protein